MSINKISEYSFKERGSKFYGFLFPSSSIKEFEEGILFFKKKYPEATHYCTAYRHVAEQIIEFSSDDGEPSGSAGLPILNILKSTNLVNCGALVIRYYGGTKLGKPGLIESYSKAIKNCVNSAELLPICKMVKIEISYQYHQEKEIQLLIRNFELIEKQSEFLESISKLFYCPIDNEDPLIQKLQSLTYMGITFNRIGYTLMIH